MVLTKRFLSNIGYAVTSMLIFWVCAACDFFLIHLVPGDTVWWHCDLIHAVEGVHGGSEDAAESWLQIFMDLPLDLPGSNRTFCHLEVAHLEQMLFFPSNSDMFNDGFLFFMWKFCRCQRVSNDFALIFMICQDCVLD